MWLNNHKLNVLNTALKGQKPSELDSVLTEITHSTDDGFMLTSCPQCGKDLVHKSLPYLELSVSACPDQHGIWMSQDSSRKFQTFMAQQISVAAKKRYYKILILGFLIGLIVIPMTKKFLDRAPQLISQHFEELHRQSEGQKIGPSYWPGRDFSHWYPLPIKEGRLDHQDELVYFQQYMTIMEEGIVNRYNIQTALDARRKPADYLMIFETYAARQENFLSKLKELQPPERLLEFHQHIIVAAEEQIEFHEEYARQKRDNPNLQLNQLLTNPHLKTCNEELWAAYHSFQRLYPEIDRATNDAVEMRLCQFDVI